MIRGLRPGIAGLLLAAASAVWAQGDILPAATRVELDNGTILLLAEKHDVPLIGIDAVVAGGGVSDPPELAGLSGLLADLLDKGAGERDAAAFAEAVAAVGGTLGATGGREAITVSGEFMSRDAELMVALLADMLRRPTLDREEFEKLQTRSISFISAAKDSNASALLPYYGDALLFADHPYGRSRDGSEASLARIEYTDIRAHYDAHVGGDRLVIAVSGAFETAAMQSLLTAAFADWRAASAERIVVPEPSVPEGAHVLLVDQPGSAQTYFWLGGLGTAIDYPSRADLDVVNTIFGGRFTSMLNNALRVEAGLTYGAYSTLTRPSRSGTVAIRSSTQAATTIEAIDMALGLLDQLHELGIDEAQIESAQNYILGQFPPRLETASQVAAALAQLEFYGLDASYYNDYGTAIRGVLDTGARAVIDEVYPRPEGLVYVLIGDADAIRADVEKYGPVIEMPITAPDFRPAPAE